MKRLCICFILVSGVATLRLFDETASERAERLSLAKRLGLKADFKLTYYISHRTLNESKGFHWQVERAASLINRHSCLVVERVYDVDEYPDLYISAAPAGNHPDYDEPTCKPSEGKNRGSMIFRSDVHDHWDVLRAMLLCLAPFQDEFRRRDRDKEIEINWENIKDGFEPNFFKDENYPPNLPGFQDYMHGCVVNRPLTYMSKFNGTYTNETMTLKYTVDETLYNQKRWQIDIHRLKIFYSQIKFPHRWLSGVWPVRVWNVEWKTAEGCDYNVNMKFDG